MRNDKGRIGRMVRRWFRAYRAYYFPLSFARWVNRERCYLDIHNDPSGTWYVTIGMVAKEQSGKTLGEAMCHAFWRCELNPSFQWTSYYLRTQ